MAKRIKLPGNRRSHTEFVYGKVVASLKISQHITVVCTGFISRDEASMHDFKLSAHHQISYAILLPLILAFIEATKKGQIAHCVLIGVLLF